MSYPSVDALQRVLVESVFHYAQDRKKAAGRALGTLVEIITFYALKGWGFRENVAIERPLPEFGNPDIAHTSSSRCTRSSAIRRSPSKPTRCR